VAHKEALVYLAYGVEDGLALIATIDNHGHTDLTYLPLPTLNETPVLALLEARETAGPTASGQLNTPRRFAGGLVWAETASAYERLHVWGASAHDALSALPPTSGFAQALVRMRDEWSAHATRSRTLLDLLNTPSVRSRGLQRRNKTNLPAPFMRFCCDLNSIVPLRCLAHLGINDVVAALEQQGIQRVGFIPYGSLSWFPWPSVLTVDLLMAIATVR
jgi:hypothetical protein